MILAVNSQGSMDKDMAFRRELSSDSVGRENSFRKLITLQNVFVHVPIAVLVTGVSTLQINDYLPAGLASRGVKPNIAALDPELSMHGVQDGPQGELHRAPGSVNRELLDGRNGLVSPKQRKTDEQRKNYQNSTSHRPTFCAGAGQSQGQIWKKSNPDKARSMLPGVRRLIHFSRNLMFQSHAHRTSHVDENISVRRVWGGQVF